MLILVITNILDKVLDLIEKELFSVGNEVGRNYANFWSIGELENF